MHLSGFSDIISKFGPFSLKSNYTIPDGENNARPRKLNNFYYKMCILYALFNINLIKITCSKALNSSNCNDLVLTFNWISDGEKLF